MIRRTACTLGALGLVAPALVALSTGTAQAAQGISSPADGTVYSSGTTVSVSGSFAGCSSIATSCPSGTLSVTDPSGASAGSTSKTATRGSSSTSLSLSVPVSSASRNGTWTVRLSSGSTTSTSHFYSNLAPAVPSGFSASTADGDAHDVFLSWSKGSEPDLQGYTLYDGDGDVVQDGISAASACSGSTCNYALYYDNPNPGTYSYSYSLSASRAGGCSSGSCAPVQSDRTSSRTASLTTPKPPPPSPTPAPTSGSGGSTGGTTGGGTTGSAGGSSSGGSGGSTGGGSGSSTSGGASNAGTGATTSASPIPLPTLDPGIQKRAFALNFSNFSASLGIPKLPPLPKTTITLPGGEGAIPQGTYQPQLPYKSATETTHSTSLIGNPISSITRVDARKLWPMIAMALILFLSAAHLRRWIGAHVED